jgi:hypothetical protein
MAQILYFTNDRAYANMVELNMAIPSFHVIVESKEGPRIAWRQSFTDHHSNHQKLCELWPWELLLLLKLLHSIWLRGAPLASFSAIIIGVKTPPMEQQANYFNAPHFPFV